MINRLRPLRAILFSAVALAAGCAATDRQDLKLVSQKSGHPYIQHFSEGYLSRDSNGETNIVLAASAEHPGGHAGVLKQVMHIRVMWRSDRVTHWEGAPDTNASIRWYVFTEHAGQPEMIEYAGTGMVDVGGDEHSPTVRLSNAQLKPAFQAGKLTDPIGPSRFEGTVATVVNRQRAEELLSDVRSTMVATSVPPQPLEAKTAEARIAP